MRIFIVGPTSRPFDDAAGEVAADLAHLARPGVVVEHRTTGGGPARVRSDRDALEAAPRVVRSMIEDWRDGAGVVVVDCTADPGADIAAAAVGIPVVGAGAALRAAFTSTYEAQAALPPAHWDELAQRGSAGTDSASFLALVEPRPASPSYRNRSPNWNTATGTDMSTMIRVRTQPDTPARAVEIAVEIRPRDAAEAPERVGKCL